MRGEGEEGIYHGLGLGLNVDGDRGFKALVVAGLAGEETFKPLILCRLRNRLSDITAVAWLALWIL